MRLRFAGHIHGIDAAAVEDQAVLLILIQQIDHRLPAVAGFAVHVFEQQQRRGATTVKQFAVGRLRIQQILRS